MQDNKNASKRLPIRTRVRRAFLVTTIVSLIIATGTGIFFMLRIMREGQDALVMELKRNLSQVVEEKAVTADVSLQHYEGYIEFLKDYTEHMYQDEEMLKSIGHFFDTARASTGEGVYAMTSVLATEDITLESVMDDIYFFSNLEPVMEPIAKENRDLITTVYLGTDTGLLASYDRWSYESAVPEPDMLYYDYFPSEWYSKGINEDDIFYTSLYVDSFGRGLTITVACPYRDLNGKVRGVIAADYDITGLYDEMISMELGEDSRSFAIDQDGNVISLDSEDKLSVAEYLGLSDEQSARITSGETGLIETDDAFYAYIPIPRVGWTLCAATPKTVVLRSAETVQRSILLAMLVFVAIALILAIVVSYLSSRLAASLTKPIELLGDDMAIIAGGDFDHTAKAYRNDELGDITHQLNEMVSKLKKALTDLASAQDHADKMSELANKDALTGIRNKTAYDKQVQNLEFDFSKGERKFGFAMIDLNFLKKINDTFGHDKGNIAIKKLCHITCTVFSHSPVFRIGGDEFIVILKGTDYDHCEALIKEFRNTVEKSANDDSLEPWERVSAAIGYALCDESIDKSVDNVFRRADEAMYQHKKAMKATRE